MQEGIKLYGFRAKSFGEGKSLTDEQLAKINKLAPVQLSADQVYARRFLLAHNCIDRDNERFTEELLANFAASLPGKGLFDSGHPSSWSGSGGPGEGRFFDASTEEMTPEAFQALTGEACGLPTQVKMVKVLWGDAYILKLESNADLRAKLDGGICSFVSIGFKAPFYDVTDDRGNHIYGEYRPKGEALEGSLVWLGAQPGASAQKSADNKTQKEGKGMKEFLKDLAKALGKPFSEEKAIDEIKSMLDDKDTEIKSLKSLAEGGKAYRESLVKDAVKYGVLIGEIDTDADSQKAEEAFLKTVPLDRLKMIKDKYEGSARQKFPAEFQIPSKDEDDKQRKAKEAEQHSGEKKKDYTDPKHNELLAAGQSGGYRQ